MSLLNTLSWEKSFAYFSSEEVWARGFQSAQKMNILYTKNNWSQNFSSFFP